MKRLIRHKETRKFLKSDGGWTSDVSEAHSFVDMRAVVASEQKLDLSGVEVLLMLEETPSDYDVVISLDAVTPGGHRKPAQ